MAPEHMLWLSAALFLAIISFIRALQGPQRIGAFAIGLAMTAQAVAIIAGLETLAMILGAVGVGLVFILFVSEALWRRRQGKDPE